jgi:cytochrome c oxidase cbb3-type subunit 3
MAAARAKYEPLYERYAAMPFDELMANDDAHQLGRSLYQNYCTTCHGSDARGATGYPNLTDDEWLYGKNEQALTMTIANGRSGVMPALAPALGGDEGIDNMVTYVRSLSGAVEADESAMQAKSMFVALCSACHGADGKGNQALGAPNLTDDNWLYGGDAASIRQTLVQGRNGVMPAHGNLLGENRVRILAAYVASLSDGDGTPK